MKLEDLQRSLDLRKWHDSEDNAMDMCRHYDFCVFCKFEADFPCARAYNRFEQSKKKEATAAKKATTAAKPAAKKATTAAKPAAKKATTAAKPAAKKATTATKPAAKKATTAKKPAAKK